MPYDIAAKTLLSYGGEQIFREFFGLPVESLEWIEELPGESATLRSTDFAFRARIDGREKIVLLEMQTRWSEDKVLNLLEYAVRFMRRYDAPRRTIVAPCMVLFLPHARARPVYQISGLTFRFRLVKLWELPAKRFLEAGPELWPFTPLMADGARWLAEAERRIYESPLPAERRGDLLSALTILTSLKDFDAAEALLRRRRDIMLEAPAYEWFAEEFRRQGLEKGREEGTQSTRLEVARRLADEGCDPALIERATDLSREELRAAGLLSD